MKYQPTIQSDELVILFGDKNSCPVDRRAEEFPDYCQQFVRDHELASLTVLNQIHSINGVVVKSHNPLLKVSLFQEDGDFLITKQRNAALAVLTADCLPVVVHDPTNNAVGVAHAGWKGTVGGIVLAMLQAMKQQFGTKSDEVKVWLGPAAQACCYKVQRSFVDNLSGLKDTEHFLQNRDGKLFFDNSACNASQLKEAGVLDANINRDFNMCTICSDQFYSHRRQGAAAFRQLSYVWLV